MRIDDTKKQFVLSTFVWSFSRLNSFYNCPYEWRLQYIEQNTAESGFFAEYGSFMHEILEKYAKGELSIFELNHYYTEYFDEKIPHEAPPNKHVDIRQSYYEKGAEYLNMIDMDFSRYEILGVEKKVSFVLFGKEFVGYIDLLLQDKKTKEIIIVDHKSSTIKLLKSGKVSKTDEEHFKTFKRQLYMYAIPIIEEYGHVHKLRWNMFKDRKWIEIEYSRQDYEEMLVWVKDTLKKIEKETEWKPNPDEYYCRYLCGQRNHACEYKK